MTVAARPLQMPGPRVRRLRSSAVGLASVYPAARAALAAGTVGHGAATQRVVPGLILFAATLLVVRGPRLVIVAALVVAVAVAAVQTPQDDSVGPVPQALGALAYAVALLYRPRTVLISLVAGSIAYILGAGRSSSSGSPRCGPPTTSSSSAPSRCWSWLLLHILEGITGRADAAERERLEVEVGSAMEGAEREGQRHLHHLLHDDVIAALRAVADGGRNAPPQLQATCRRTAAAIRDAEHPSDLPPGESATSPPPRPRRAPGSSCVPSSRRRARRPPTVRLTSRQAGALGRAIGEALRNVERHTEEAVACVGWWTTPTHHVLHVVDHGPGVRDDPPGWGRRNAIQAPLRDIGGEASVTSPEDGGTIVELRWPVSRQQARNPLVETHRETSAALGDPRVVLWIALFALPAQVYLMLRDIGHGGVTAYEAGYGVLAVAAILAVALRLQRHHLGPAALALLAVGTAAGAGGLVLGSTPSRCAPTSPGSSAWAPRPPCSPRPSSRCGG